MRTIGVLSGGFSEETLRAAGAAAVYRDIAELADRYQTAEGGLGLDDLLLGPTRGNRP